MRPRVEVFAVEDTSVELTWSALPTREATIEVGGQAAQVQAAPPAWLYLRGRRPRPLSPLPGGPGAVSFQGLQPATRYEAIISGSGLPRTLVASFTTLPSPPGRLLSRFATISDCHIGERHFGALGMIVDGSPSHQSLDPYPLRCTRAALCEAAEWGAGLLAVKGDLTQRSRPQELEVAVRLLDEAGLPVIATLGNHDVRRSAVSMADYGIDVRFEPWATDLPGARLVAAHTPLKGRHAGAVDPGHAAVARDLAASAPGPAVVMLHHPPDPWPIPTHYPPGIPWAQARRLARMLAEANPSTLLIAGHTHRNRLYSFCGLTVSEVGSTKDYPGVWAGYAVHEGGIRQVVRRIMRPDVMAWTEATRRALGGLWGLWSPGRLSDRCFVLEWPDRR